MPGLHLLETEVEDFDVRAAVIVGSERAVVFDTLAHPLHMADVAGLVGSLPVTVVYSHADWDHAWGTCALRGVDGVVAQDHAADRFNSDVPEELHTRRGREPGVWDEVILVPPTRTFAVKHVVHLGDVTLELHALPGHTPDCIVGLLPEWGVLLAGDTVETPLPVVNDGGVVGAWAAYLAGWMTDARVRVVVPSHGRTGGREVVEHTLRYLEGLPNGIGPDDLASLPAFYRDTHRRNLALMGAEGGTPAT